MKIFATSYDNPDLDGLASMYSYCELLKLQGKKAEPVICGVPVDEAQFMIDRLGLKINTDQDVLKNAEGIIIVDSSDPDMIWEGIDPAKVIEVIDHRNFHALEGFANASGQIEPVGACATLIAEKFKAEKVEPSENAAVLLRAAISSNTINFKANVTTDRDREMAQWLEPIAKFDDELIREMFEHKSKFDGTIKEWFMRDYKRLNIAGNVIAIIQHEIINVSDFVKENMPEIKKAIDEIYHEYKYDYLFLSYVDVLEGYNEFVCTNDKTQELVEEALNIKFENNFAKTDNLILRKEIIPKIKKILERH